jgi:hypothetical protein
MTLSRVDEYVLRIDFEKESEHPERIFKAMSEMIDALYLTDKNLAHSFSLKIDPKLILEDIETGSIKAKLRAVINSIDDDALKDVDIKKAIGSFLVKGKHKLLKALEDKKEIKSLDDIRYLEGELVTLAQETGVQGLPMYCPLPIQILLKNMSKFYGATSVLLPRDSVTYISPEGEVFISQGLNLSEQKIEELLTRETVESKNEMILRVKKPDYLGQSMWDVQYGGKTIQVKIIDFDWLEEFQNRVIDVRPGDSLRAIVIIEVRYGYDNTVISEYYTISKIMEVIKPEVLSHKQNNLFESKDN